MECHMHRQSIARLALAAIGFAVFCVTPAHASSVEHMTLRELVDRAHRIVRGTVIAADESTVSAGGGRLPIVVYRIRVSEVVKGSVPGGDVLEVRLLSRSKTMTARNRTIPLFRDLPELRVGQQYLLALTAPSAIGLSTTVGLGQGLFELRGAPGREEAVNRWNNLGLLDDSLATAGARARAEAPAARAASVARASGPVPYATLVNEIRARMGR
jgi:hypothetical protein